MSGLLTSANAASRVTVASRGDSLLVTIERATVATH